jgi:hypothetical protein
MRRMRRGPWRFSACPAPVILALAVVCALTAGGGGAEGGSPQHARPTVPGSEHWLALSRGRAARMRGGGEEKEEMMGFKDEGEVDQALVAAMLGSGQQGAAEAVAAGQREEESGAVAVGEEAGRSLAEQDADALVSYARLLGATRRPGAAGAAGQALRLALDLNPRSADAAEAYARLLHEDGRAADAARLYRRALLLPEASAAETGGSARDEASAALPPPGGGLSDLIARLAQMAQPAQQVDALAGFAALLLAQPALALDSDGLPSAGAPLSASGTGARRRGPRNSGAWAPPYLDTCGVQDSARRLLLHAMALAPSSAACADGLQDMVSAAMLHPGEDAMLWPRAHSAAVAPHRCASENLVSLAPSRPLCRSLLTSLCSSAPQQQRHPPHSSSAASPPTNFAPRHKF